MTTCKICGNASGFKVYTLRETMYGMDETFEYFECPFCETLQIKSVPQDLARYYGDTYNSFQNPPKLKDNRIKAFLKSERAKSCVGRKNIFRTLLKQVYKPPMYFEWLEKVNIDHDSSILDVGCGAGHLLISLRKDGFRNVSGIDKFIPRNVKYANGVSIIKSDLDRIHKKYDFIMLHHSFEHMPEPVWVLKQLFRLLKHDCYVLIRIPVFGNFAWQEYGTDWVQLDAPRHLYLYSEKSMRLMAENAGFKIRDTVYDSTEFQFWGSEQCRDGIALLDGRSFAVDSDKSGFSRHQIKAFKAKAFELNKTENGDQACFYLHKE